MAEDEPIDHAEVLRRECALVDDYIKQVVCDTGAAYAYRFRDDDKRRDNHLLLANLNVYAMVGASLTDDKRQMERIDYFLPVVTASPREKSEAAALGLVRVGFIQNHYNDVLGLCEGNIDNTLDEFAATMNSACYARLESLTPEQANVAAIAWGVRDAKPMTDAKRDIIRTLTEYKHGLIGVYHTHISTDNQKHPEWN